MGCGTNILPGLPKSIRIPDRFASRRARPGERAEYSALARAKSGARRQNLRRTLSRLQKLAFSKN